MPQFYTMLKNVFLYYVSILAPFMALIYFGREMHSNIFVICFFTYLLLYRPVIDRIRLIDKGIITREKAFRFYFPGVHYYYFKELYLP